MKNSKGTGCAVVIDWFQLIKALESDDPKQMMSIIGKSDVNKLNNHVGWPLIRLAIEAEAVNCIDQLVSSGVDIYKPMDFYGGSSWLVLTVYGPLNSVTKCLLDIYMNDIKTNKTQDFKIIFRILCVGRTDILDYLLGNNLDPNLRDDDGYTLLHKAVMSGDLKATRLLIKYGADPDLKDEYSGRTIYDDINDMVDDKAKVFRKVCEKSQTSQKNIIVVSI